jgi:SAM-dependent methyltransferase
MPQKKKVPMPSFELMKKVGSRITEADDPEAGYERVGAACREQILRMLPAGYELEGRRLLDFGCGAGRTLRHFLDEAESAEIWGCDIDGEAIDWLQSNLCPPLHVLRNETRPGLPFEDGHFDVIWALSVFTHLVDEWAPWMLELHRLLAEDGILIATSLGPQHSERIASEPWDEDRIGMNALRSWAAYPDGAPVVLHSTWWLRAHWGRVFEILEMDEPFSGFTAPAQRWLAMRKRDVTLTATDLEAPEPGEPREYAAVAHNVQQLRRELKDARDRLVGQPGQLRDQGPRPTKQGQRLGEQRKLLRAMLGSRAFAVAELLSRLSQRGQPVFSREQVRRALGDDDPRTGNVEAVGEATRNLRG